MSASTRDEMKHLASTRHAQIVAASKEIWRRRNRLLAVIGAIPISLIASSIGVTRKLEAPLLDVYAKLRPPPSFSAVALVRITDSDYRSLFKEKSPLDPSKLQEVISAIARGGARVIGVDIDTSATQFREIKPESWWPPVIWARSGVFSNINKRFRLDDVLGVPTPPAA